MSVLRWDCVEVMAGGMTECALRQAFSELLAEQFCPSTSGGTGGSKWCLNHDDQPMVSETECALVQRCRVLLHPEEAE